jgi:hypothetical protein
MWLAANGRAGEPAKAEMLIRLDVEPAPAPRPALRYQLLPELAEMSPGNPIQGYLVCSMEHQAFLFDKAACDRREELLAMPLKELPAPQLQEYGRSALAEADRAARLDNPDWQILQKLKVDGIWLLLPDVQQIRAPARALAVRLRAELAVGRYDDAVRTLKTMFAMASHMGRHPTLIGNLVGIAIGSIALGPLEEMLQQPGCPNLFWALTYLPRPLVPIAMGMDGERTIGASLFRDLDDRGPMDPDRIKRFIAEIDKLVGTEEPLKSAGGLRKWLDARAKGAAEVEAVRRRLVEVGLPEERVRRFPADQAILLDERREYQVRLDDEMKVLKFPFWKREELAARTTGAPARKPALFADLLTPATKAVRHAEVRLEQRLALLQNVEAVRMHAAGHGGSPPGAVAEIDLPLRDDPVTGKPFLYEAKGTTAHLRGTPPVGEEGNAFFNVHYEINFRK